MSILSKLLGTSKTKTDIFDKDSGLLAKAGAWFGNRNFTEEERAELKVTTTKAVQGFVVDTLSENTDRSIARREIAVFFIQFYSLLLFMTGMTYPIDPEWSAVWFSLATSLSVGGVVTAISIFFFGSHAMSKFQKGKE